MNKKSISLLNPANVFTSLRIPLSLAGIWLYLEGHTVLGVFVIAAAALTDLFDGKVARKFHCETDFGAKFDQIADKIMMLIIVIFALFQIGSGYQLLILVGIILVETAMISANRYARVTKNYDLIVSKTGKRAMFARMTAVAWLLFGTAGVGSFFDFVGILGAISGVIGVILGAQALSGYIKQITSLKSS